jgi:tRNA(Ile)-lysidine synthase
VAHTADDQVETVLMHLLRGAGLTGLRGMAYRSLPNPWSGEIPLVRPLLGVWREEIVRYLEQYHLQATLDASNLDMTYYRNRLRHEALPYLDTLNPGIRQRLWKTAELLREEEDLIEAITAKAWQDCALIVEEKAIAFDADRLRQQPLAVQRRLFRWAIARLRPSLRNIDFESIERALAFLRSPTRSSQTDLISNLRLEQEGARLWLAEQDAALPGADWPQIPPGVGLRLDIPGEVELAASWRMRAEVYDNTPQHYTQAIENPDPYQAWLNRATLQSPLLVRCRRPGDRFQPLGMGGRSLKLSDFMINVRLPRRAREGWPLVLSGEEIAWLPGYRPGERFAVRKETPKIVLLTFRA